jgi:hypothetical protein
MIYDEMKMGGYTGVFSFFLEGWDGGSAGRQCYGAINTQPPRNLYHRMEVVNKLSFCVIVFLSWLGRCVVSFAVDT